MSAAAEFFRKHPLFGGLNPRQLEQLTNYTELRRFRKGEEVLAPSASASEFLIVVLGQVDVYSPDPATGLEVLSETIKAPLFYGGEDLLSNSPRQASIRAREDCAVYVFNRKTFMAMMNSLPGVGLAMSRLLAARLAAKKQDTSIPFVSLARMEVDPYVVQMLPKKVVTQFKVAAIKLDEAGVTVAMVNPFNVMAIDRIRRHIQGVQIHKVAVSEDDFEGFTKKALALVPETATRRGEITHLPALKKREFNIRYVEDAYEQAEEAGERIPGEQVVALVNQVLGEALEYDASDIHIEPEAEHINVRYRVDGKLLPRPEPVALRFYAPLLTRLKVLGRLDITEKRKPQDGRIAIFRNNREIDFRVSTLPTRFGEKMVLRVLDRSSFMVGLNKLIVIDDVYETVRSMVEQPYGIVLFAGPTGSGKTTTLYSCITHRKDEGINIATIEDPIEYTIPGISQVNINPNVSLNFADAVRAMLRQDPDIIMVGETRDAATASAALTAALMGHLVLTSLHTNGSISSIIRLRDMGLEPFLISNATVGVVYQRLLRKVCPDCRVPYTFHDPLIERLRPKNSEHRDTYFIGKGCRNCNQTGYRGRVGAFEVFRLNDELRQLIGMDADLAELREAADRAGFVSMNTYCHRLMSLGVTTPQDVLRIIYSDED